MISGGQKQRIAIVRALAMNRMLCSLTSRRQPLTPKWWEKYWGYEGACSRGNDHGGCYPRNGICQRGRHKGSVYGGWQYFRRKPPVEFFTNPEHPRLQDFLAKVLIWYSSVVSAGSTEIPCKKHLLLQGMLFRHVNVHDSIKSFFDGRFLLSVQIMDLANFSLVFLRKSQPLPEFQTVLYLCGL